MKSLRGFSVYVPGIIISLVLIGLLVLQGCSSSYRSGSKHNYGMVPCPCEKKNHR
jgi:hypothetical protein